jgi:hypothetical protein
MTPLNDNGLSRHPYVMACPAASPWRSFKETFVYILPYSVLLKVVQGRIGGSFIVFLTVSIDCAWSTKCKFLTWPRPFKLIGYCIPLKVVQGDFCLHSVLSKVVQGRVGGSFIVFLTVFIDCAWSTKCKFLTWPRPFKLIGYCIPLKVFEAHWRSFQRKLIVFLTVSINCTGSTKCMM